MHVTPNQVQTRLPRPDLIEQVLLTIKAEDNRSLRLSPTSVSLMAEAVLGMKTMEITLSDEEFTAKLMTKDNQEQLQFLRDQLENYSEDLSKDFAAGVLAAISIFKGEKFLEDYLGES